MSFKLRHYPAKRQIEALGLHLSESCRLYNAALQERRDAWRMSKKSISFYDQDKQLKEIRAAGDIQIANFHVARDVLQRVDRAFKAFFRRVKNGEKPGYPRFKGKRGYDSITFLQPSHGYKLLSENKLRLQGIGDVKLKQHRPIEGKIKTCTIKREIDKWFVCFAVESNQSRFFPKTGDSVGVDVGVLNFATLSTGEVVDNPKYFMAAARKLRITNRSVSRKRQRSGRWRKQVQSLAKQHKKIVNQRRDFFHKVSLQLVREFDEVVFEDLNIQGLMKNHHLAGSIIDAAWGTFIYIHERKAVEAGRSVIKVAPHFTSQKCSNCGSLVKKSLAVREHQCIACGLVLDRDHNAAINIKALARIGPAARAEVAKPSDPQTALRRDHEEVRVLI